MKTKNNPEECILTGQFQDINYTCSKYWSNLNHVWHAPAYLQDKLLCDLKHLNRIILGAHVHINY